MNGKKADEVYLDDQLIGTVTDSFIIPGTAGVGGNVFLPPPYSDETHCGSLHTAKGITYGCCLAKGHAGVHGHPDYAGSWGDLQVAKPQAKVEVVIPPGQDFPSGVRINGWTVPHVKDVTVEYEAGQPRVVILEIYATELVEVSE